MSNITFNKEAKQNFEKEEIEWIRIWCEDTDCKDLPRVALIGDSITEGYYNFVKELLKDVAKVDYLATSYSIASNTYIEFVKSFINDSDYEIVHFNYGLHAYSVSDEIYSSRCEELLQFILKSSKAVVATTTTVLDEASDNENLEWKDKIINRNENIIKIANKLNLNIDDLNVISKRLDITKRNTDGVHFVEEGYKELAESVVSSVKKVL